MNGGILLDRTTGRPLVDEAVRSRLADRPEFLEHLSGLVERSRLMPALRMAEVTPPLFMDVSNAYSGDELGLPYRDLIGEGIVGATDLAVTGQAGANSINVAAGAAWILGDTNVNQQPNYRAYNNGVVNLGISPDPSNPRRVLVGAQITDQGFSGTGRLWALTAIHGTAAASPVLPATPASFLPLANILVPAAAASSAAYTITDLRARATIGAGQAAAGGVLPVYATLAALTAAIPSPTNGQQAWINPGGDVYQATNAGQQILMTYNSTTSKWVSQEIVGYSVPILSANNYGYVVAMGTNATSIAGSGTIAYKPYALGAGLILQGRFRGEMYGSVDTTGTMYVGANANDRTTGAGALQVYFANVANPNGASSWTMIDSGWTIAAGGTLSSGDEMRYWMQLNSGLTAQTYGLAGTMYWRWSS